LLDGFQQGPVGGIKLTFESFHCFAFGHAFYYLSASFVLFSSVTEQRHREY
jgi:hypothetical protein